MQLTPEDIESFAEYINRDFESKCSERYLGYYLPCFKFAREYLRLRVYCRELTKNKSILGISSCFGFTYQPPDTDIRPFYVSSDDIVLEKDMTRTDPFTDSARLGFTIIHECAHHILYRLENKLQESKENTETEESSYSGHTEKQANSLAAALLVPRYLLLDAIEKICQNRDFVFWRYHGIRFYATEQEIIRKLCAMFGVSKQMMGIRLLELGRVKDIYDIDPVKTGGAGI